MFRNIFLPREKLSSWLIYVAIPIPIDEILRLFNGINTCDKNSILINERTGHVKKNTLWLKPEYAGITLRMQFTRNHAINSLWPSDATWPHWSGSTLAQVMDCLPDGTKPLPEPMLTYHQGGPVKITLRMISLEMHQPSITKVTLKITYLKF